MMDLVNVDDAIKELQDIKAREKGNNSKKIVLPSGNEVVGFWVEGNKIVIMEGV